MGKSAVLKDLSHRPGGYFCSTKEGIVCRAQLSEPAQAVIVFCDGSRKTFALAAGGAEQHFSCTGKEIDFVYVYREENLLLISDETAKRAFHREQKMRNAHAAKRACAVEAKQEDVRPRKAVPEENRALPQRRWPPPPAWETAYYQNGSWQETQTPPD